jgi:uncharacterized protein with von Willebrand factor type A (vWA) domain
VTPGSSANLASHGRLAENVVHFVRVLRGAGLKLGTDRALLAVEALGHAGIASRSEFRAVLEACLVDRPEHMPLFDEAFEAFWRDPDLAGQLLRLRLPAVAPRRGLEARSSNARLAEALAAGSTPRAAPPEREPQSQQALTAGLSWSDRERLRRMDFEAMTTAEWHAARRLIGALDPQLPEQRTRRRESAARGAIAMGKALRDMARHGGELTRLSRCRPRTRPAPLVVLIDISGSMGRYSRMLLHFAQQLAGGEGSAGRRVQVFVFGTRLTHVTRCLVRRDPDVALAALARAVEDWAGGTRIAQCLGEYNRRWLQRTGSSRATVLLATDGLDHASFEMLAGEMRRLRLGCRRLLWLNPLLRYEHFEPRARGIRAMLPHVDRLLPMHNVESLEALAGVLLAAKGRETSPWR